MQTSVAASFLVCVLSMSCVAAPARFAELRVPPVRDELPRNPTTSPSSLPAVDSPESWEKRRVELRREWDVILGALPAERVPLKIEVVSTEDLTDHTRLLL